MSRCNILISSAGRRVSLLQTLRRDLGDLDIDGRLIATDMSRLTAAGRSADEFVEMPPIAASGYPSELVSMCERYDVRLVIPTIDTELGVLAQLRDRLSARGTMALCSGPRTVAIAEDKLETARWLSRRGLPTVQTLELREARNNAAEFQYPLIAKPRRGSASIGVQAINGAAELLALHDEGLVVQAEAPGHEYTVDVWIDREGRPRCAVPRQRIEVRAGEVSKGVTVKRQDIMDLATDLASGLPDAFGPLTVQIFAEGDVLHVIEVNPRFGGGYPLSWQAGARYPRWAIQEALDLRYDPADFGGWRDGLVMLRYDEAVFVDRRVVGL